MPSVRGRVPVCHHCLHLAPSMPHQKLGAFKRRCVVCGLEHDLMSLTLMSVATEIHHRLCDRLHRRVLPEGTFELCEEFGDVVEVEVSPWPFLYAIGGDP